MPIGEYNYNGLMQGALPNVYVDKITLEGAHKNSNKIAANRESAIELHIDLPQSVSAKNSGYATTTIEDAFIDKPTLTVTYNLYVEVLDTGPSVLSYIENVFKYLKINIMTLHGPAGIAVFKYLVGHNTTHWANSGYSAGSAMAHVPKIFYNLANKNEWPTDCLGNDGGCAVPPGGITPEKESDYEFSSVPIDIFLQDALGPLNNNAPDAEKLQHTKNKLELIKKNYLHKLPSGMSIYKIPVQVKQDIKVANTHLSDLAAVVTCAIDPSVNLELGLGSATDYYADALTGRIATEIIIKDGKIPKKGMMFFISADQETGAAGALQQKAFKSNLFAPIKGNLWLGEVHRFNNRFKAGRQEQSTDYTATAVERNTPFLDYVLVDNNRVQDFRQVEQVKKVNFDLTDFQSNVFGANYVNLQSKVRTADFSRLNCFSNLACSVDKNRLIRLHFSIDWGKIFKRYSGVPRLLDCLATETTLLSSFFKRYAAPQILSFSVFRERMDTSHDIVNQTERELVYDGYPNIFYLEPWSDKNWDGSENPLKAKTRSALIPIDIDYGTPPKDGILKKPNSYGAHAHVQHFSFTDYNIGKTSKGVFKYSIELELADPTFQYFIEAYNTIRAGTRKLGEYVALANGSYSSKSSDKMNYFNPYSGKFNKKFIAAATQLGFTESEKPLLVEAAISKFNEVINLLQNDKNFDGIAANSSLLNPTTATPDSISAIYNLMIHISTNLENIVQSFSNIKIPKTTKVVAGATESGNVTEQYFTKSPVSEVSKKTIKIEYSFDDPAELVDVRKTDAGYDFFTNLTTYDQSTFHIGLKIITAEDYNAMAMADMSGYFHNLPGGAFDSGIKLGITDALYPQQDLVVPIDLKKTVGRYLSVPANGVYLPKYIVDNDKNNENKYWQITNNILRYKMNLLGDTSKKNSLGYGGASHAENGYSGVVDNKIPGSLAIDNEMERVLKEYQTLAAAGINFMQKTVLNPNDVGKAYDKWENENNPIPDPALDQSLEYILNDGEKFQIPWKTNVGQEPFLLSLINSTIIAPSIAEMKLGAWNPRVTGSPMEKYISSYLLHSTEYSTDDMIYLGNYMNTIESLGNIIPYQVLSLAVNHPQNNTTMKSDWAEGVKPPNNQHFLVKNANYYNSSFLYQWGGDMTQIEKQLESAGLKRYEIEYSVNNKAMNIDKFGHFWFKHMNLGEVKYLAGYGTPDPIPPINIPEPEEAGLGAFMGSLDPGTSQVVDTSQKYENIFNGNVKSETWLPLNFNNMAEFKNKLNSTAQLAATKAPKYILCKIDTHMCPPFSKRVYDLLKMPIFDQYFYLSTQMVLEAFHGQDALLDDWQENKKSTETHSAYVPLVGALEWEGSTMTWWGISPTDAGVTWSHSHLYQVDVNGNGFALESKMAEEESQQDHTLNTMHTHKIVNWVVQPSVGHSHGNLTDYDVGKLIK